MTAEVVFSAHPATRKTGLASSGAVNDDAAAYKRSTAGIISTQKPCDTKVDGVESDNSCRTCGMASAAAIAELSAKMDLILEHLGLNNESLPHFKTGGQEGRDYANDRVGQALPECGLPRPSHSQGYANHVDQWQNNHGEDAAASRRSQQRCTI